MSGLAVSAPGGCGDGKPRARAGHGGIDGDDDAPVGLLEVDVEATPGDEHATTVFVAQPTSFHVHVVAFEVEVTLLH